ncbi:Gfo/Idh/MocA family protein [Cyclobacterium xiamenense]|uniref:Gfo/Idh/MocA family protein n=1 Tax=Cyclobacterium xiamenense TaxID=1297121 RepID=UPI0035CED243
MNSLDRRYFLKLSTLALGGISMGLLSNPSKAVGLKQNLRLGFVGIGGRGSYHLDTALGITGVEIPAICDIDPKNLYQAKRWIEESGQPSPRLYDRGPTDFIRLCEEEELDAVICATPWDTHAPVCLAAMRNGKHAACEVPIAQTLEEAWELVETFESTGK